MVGFPLLLTATKVYIASLTFNFSLLVLFCFQTSIKTSIDELKALETLASIVKILPLGTGSPKATLLIDAVTTICSECLIAAMLATLSIRAKSSPPKRLFKLLVSPGKTMSV